MPDPTARCRYPCPRATRGEHDIAFAAGDAQVEEGVLGLGFDLGRKHAGGGPPGLAARGDALDQQHPAPGHRQFAGTSGADRAAAYDDNIRVCRHLESDETI
jgi:hypothetical protein